MKEKEKSNSIDFSFFLVDQVILFSLPYFSVNDVSVFVEI